MNLNSYRRNWLKWLKAYEKRAYKIMQSAFKDIGNQIPFDKLTPDTYQMYIEASITEEAIEKAYFDIYLEIGTAHGLKMGKLINDDIKDFAADVFTQAYRLGLMEWIREFTGINGQIKTVKQNYVDLIKELIAQGIKDNKTMSEITTEIHKLVNSPTFYRWQAERIARTESTGAANRAAIAAGRNANVVYEKVWISATDARTRRIPRDEWDHLHMHTKTVLEGEPFKVLNKLGVFEFIDYPGAKETPFGTPTHAGNIINCRCSTAVVAKRDANGRIMRK